MIITAHSSKEDHKTYTDTSLPYIHDADNDRQRPSSDSSAPVTPTCQGKIENPTADDVTITASDVTLGTLSTELTTSVILKDEDVSDQLHTKFTRIAKFEHCANSLILAWLEQCDSRRRFQKNW